MKIDGIIESINNNKVVIKTFKKSSCSHCGSCSEEQKTKNFFTFINTSDRKIYVGEKITVEVDNTSVIGIGVFIYIIPIIAMFFAYYFATLFTKSNLIEIVISFIGLIIMFSIIYFFDKKIGKKVVNNIKIKSISKN